jgi:hypothetical protein
VLSVVTATVGAETHIGLGALDHKLMVGATLAGYDAIRDNITKLVAVARMQAAAAKRAVGGAKSVRFKRVRLSSGKS